MDLKFDTLMERRYCGAEKWEDMKRLLGDKWENALVVSTADMDFPMAPEIVKALKHEAENSVFGYTVATDKYYDAVIGWMKRRHDWEIKKEWISIAPGVVPALYYILDAFTSVGDGVIIQPPVYYPFFKVITHKDRKIATNLLKIENGKYLMDFDDLEIKAREPNNKLLILCSPHNPVGRVWTKQELEKVYEICHRNNVLVVSDEIHFDMVYKPNKHTVFAKVSESAKDNCIVCTAPSKTFNIAGLQCSNIIIPNQELRNAYNSAAAKAGFTMLNAFAYTACEAAYNRSEKWYDELWKYIEANADYAVDYINKHIPKIKAYKPEGSYLLWLDCNKLGMKPDELENYMKKKLNIFFTEGYIFGSGGEGFERLNLAYPRDYITKVLERMKENL